MASPKLPTKTIAGVTVVDTPLVQAAQAYARAHSDDMTFNHVMRSWLFGVVIYQRLKENGAWGLSDFDLEAHALSAIFHDLGWDCTGELISTDRRFEVDGAIAAREWIRAQQAAGKTENWDEHRLQLVWDAIALHTTVDIAKYKEPLVGLGIGCDFQGPNSDASGTITWDDFNAVKAEFPRNDLSGGIRKIICGFCRTKPQTTYCNFAMTYGMKYVDGYLEASKGQMPVDLVDASIED